MTRGFRRTSLTAALRRVIPGARAITAVLAVTAALAAAATQARAADMVFLSSQLRPLEEATKMRDVILKDFHTPVLYVPDFPQQLLVRLNAEAEAGRHTISAVGALHGELQPFAQNGLLVPLDDLAAKLAPRGFPPQLETLAKLGGAHPMYIPWMQATYIMVASKKALPYLPAGANLQALTYAQLAQWAQTIQEKTGQRALGFPAGPQGLMARFFEGYLYPSYTGGVVTPFRSAEAETMWTEFRALWKFVNPNSTNYNFMQEPLLSGDVLIGFDHVARVLGALREKPDEFVAFPAPAGPKGRGYMPVVAGLAIARGAPDPAGAAALIDYLTQPEIQIRTAVASGFFPVVKAELPADLPPGIRLAAGAIAATQNAPDIVASLLPVGLGSKDGEFNKVYLDTFQRIVLRGQNIHEVLDREAADLRRVIDDTKAACWQPDKASQGACPVS
jgi:multiple sugar transport system substrate-binding protein